MAPPWLTLVTGDPYQPTRAYYQLHESVTTLTDCFQKLDCIVPGNRKGQWLWQFEAEAQRLRFECIHRQLPSEARPVTLGQFEISEPDSAEGQATVALTLFSFDRLLQAIPFFDRHISRNIITATKMRLVNHFFTASEVEQPLRYKHVETLLEGDHVKASRADEVLAKVEELATLGSDATERMLEITNFLEQVAQEPRPEVEELPINFYEDGIISLEMILNTRRKEAMDAWGDRN